MKRYIRVVIVICWCSALLAQEAAPVQVDEGLVWQHRTGALRAVHTDKPRNRYGMDYVQLEVVVGVDGRVESAKATDGPEEFYSEAIRIVTERTYKPFEQSGEPVRALIKDYVSIVPPEQWGAKTPFPEVQDWKTLKITLERTACFGSCPQYAVEIRGDGSVTYDGQSSVFIPGKHHAHISREAVRSLVLRFRDADYLSLKNEYVTGITDNPTYTTAIEFDGVSKKVKDYVGQQSGMPDVVVELEKAIDETAGTDRWLKETPETWPSLVAEHWDFKANTVENKRLVAQLVAKGSPGLVQKLIAAGAPTLSSGEGGESALASAAGRGDFKLVAQMLEGHDNIDGKTLYAALRAGARSGNVDIVKLLIAKGADVNGKPSDPRDTSTVLMAAAESGRVEVIQEVLQHNPDVNATGYRGTALAIYVERSSKNNDVESGIRALVAAGSDVNEADEQGNTPIFIACYNAKAIKPLADAGANLNQMNRNGQTALMSCFSKDAVAALLEAGADPSIHGRDGLTAAEAARKMGASDKAILIEETVAKLQRQ